VGENKMIKISEKILLGNFNEINDNTYTVEELEDTLLKLAFDSKSLSVYGYVSHLLIKKETSNYHYLAYMILFHALNFLDGAYYTALYHAKRAVDLSPERVDFKENLLLFYELPEKILDEIEARRIANDILELDPKNNLALNFISEL
jgi:hypothetical protein